MIKEIGTLAFLGVNAWMDIKKKEISLTTIGIFAAAGMMWSLFQGRNPEQIGIPLGIGAVFLVLSLGTKGAVGLGDVWLLLALGLMLDAGEFIGMLCTGLLLAGLWALFSLVVLKKGRHSEIPFVPFLLAGYIGGLCL